MINLTPIFEALIALLAALVVHKLIPWIKAKTTNEQQTGLAVTIKTLVFAAEQIYGSGAGYEKMQYVKTQLEKRGFQVDTNAIEAAVLENFKTLHAGYDYDQVDEQAYETEETEE